MHRAMPGKPSQHCPAIKPARLAPTPRNPTSVACETEPETGRWRTCRAVEVGDAGGPAAVANAQEAQVGVLARHRPRGVAVDG